MKGQYDRAIADFDVAIELRPDYAGAFRNRGGAYGMSGQYDRAIADFDVSIELNPDDAEAYIGKATVLNMEAWDLATSGNADERDGREAVRLAMEAVVLYNAHGNRIALAAGFAGTLAAAYAAAGRFDDAVAEQERAIEMLRVAGEQDDVDAARSRLDLYRRRQPYRE